MSECIAKCLRFKCENFFAIYAWGFLRAESEFWIDIQRKEV